MNQCKVIAIANQKGGVGKTVSTISLGVISPDELNLTIATVSRAS